jgi:P27 family predicted phage terminase small subunit
MRGRKPKPTAARRLEGNPGKRPLNEAEPTPPPLGTDPAWLAPVELADHPGALAEWQRLAPMLAQCRQITEADRAALLALCLEWARYLVATQKVQSLGLVVKSPSGYPMTNPYLSIASRALASCNKLWPELGLTPSSRSRVRTDGPGPAGDAFSEFDAPMPTTTPQ